MGRIESGLRIAAFLTLAPLAAGCSGGSGLTTGSLGSLLGGGEKKPETAAPAAPVVNNTPTTRAFQVAGTAARAVKCGYNFDPARLKSSFLAAEAQTGTPVDELGKVERVYNVAFNGVAKAIAPNGDYCSPQKTTEIKTALSRHLAGDYTPSPPKPAEPEEGGLFSFGTDTSGGDKGPIANHPMDNSR